MPATLIAAVDDSPASMQAARLLAGYQGGAVDDALLRQGELQVQPARALLAEAGFDPEIAVLLSIPSQAIVEESMRRRAKAIVMGTRGHGALGGFALGSVALRVAHRSQIPTLLVKPKTGLPQALGRHVRVLVPLDGSAHATRAIAEVLGWKAWLGEMQLDLVHIHAPLTLFEAMLPPHRDVLDQWGGKQSEEATRDARALLYAAQLGHRLHEAAGEPSAEIARLADALGSELIVMGTRGLGAVHHALLGSVALKVAHASAVPVAPVP